MNRKKDLKLLIDELNSQKTEEDILHYLLEIVKRFSFFEYQKVFINPFYKSLIPDIQKIVLSEITDLRNSITQEIDTIDKELKKVDNPEEESLRNLKRDCISLLYEIDEKRKDIENLH